MKLLLVWIGCWWLAAFFVGVGWLFFRYIKIGNFTQGPAAIGRSLGFILISQIIAFLVVYLVKTPIQMLSDSATITAVFDVVKLLAAMGVCALSALIAMRVTDDTASMNLKIVALVGILPNTLACFFGFFGFFDTGFFAYVFFGFPVWVYTLGWLVMTKYPHLVFYPNDIQRLS